MTEVDAAYYLATPRAVTVLDAINSVDFVRRILASYAEGKVVLVATDQVKEQGYFGLQVAEHMTPEVSHGWLRLDYIPRTGGEPAQIVSTSGTEGKPKGIVLSHGNLADTVRRLNDFMRVDGSISEYVGIPVTHSFGLGRCRAVLAAGGRVFLPAKGFNLSEIQELLRGGEINAISAVPTLWRLVLQNPQALADCADKVRWIEIGSQYMSPDEKRAMRDLFKNACIVQHYGLTEASRSTFLDISEASDADLASVGSPVGGVEVSISESGRIRVRGGNVAMGRMADGRITPIADAEGWFETSDSGRIVGGRLYYEGRADDVINCGGLKVSPEPLEAALRAAFPRLAELAICGVPDALRGEGFLVVLRGGDADVDSRVQAALDGVLANHGIFARSSIHVMHVEDMPKTSNGKIQRRKLASLFKPPTPGRAPSDDATTGVKGLYERLFGVSNLGSDVSFTDLGGDSLNYVQMEIELEKKLGRLPTNWENLSIAELERFERDNPGQQTARRLLESMDLSIALRAFAIITVVAIHAGYLSLGGATIMLMLLIGYNFGRFQSAAMVRGEIWPPIWNFAKNILLPFYLIQFLYLLVTKNFELETWLLFSNFLYISSQFLIPVWFVLNFVQILLAVGLCFAFPPWRRWFSADKPNRSLIVLCVLTAFQALMYFFVQDSQYRLFYPYMYLPVFWLGWTIHFSGALRHKLMVTLLLLALVPLNQNIGIQHLWLLLSGLPLIWVPAVRLPGALKSAVTTVAAATYTIFVLNLVILWVIQRAALRLGIDSAAIRLPAFFATMACCLIAWWVMDKRLLWRWGAKFLSARKP